MPVVKLTQRLVDDLLGAEAPPRDVFYWHDRMAGFGAKHKAGSGRVSWVIQWRDPKSGNSHRLALGDAAKVKLDRARAAAETRFGDIAGGKNPLTQRASYREAPSFDKLADDYLASDVWKVKAPSTKVNDAGRIAVYLRPALGAKKLVDITDTDVRRLLRELSDPAGATALATKAGKTKATPRGGEGGARRTIRLLKAMFAFAIDEKLLTSNPADGVKLGTDGERDTVPDDLAYNRFWTALDELRPTSWTMARACDVFAICALTGARRGEVQRLRWRQLDLEGRRIVLAAGEHKAGYKTRQSRVISLPDDAVAILSGYTRGEARPDDLVFHGLKLNQPVALQRPWERVAEVAALPPEITPHTLRHGLGTALAAAGMAAPQIASVLGHKQWRTSERYVHAVDRARAAAAQAGAELVRPKKLRAVT